MFSEASFGAGHPKFTIHRVPLQAPSGVTPPNNIIPPTSSLMDPDQLNQAQGGQVSPIFGLIIGIVYLAIVLITIIGLWKTFTKAAEPGWASIIPIYNVIVLLKIAGKPLWWIILFFIPLANLVVGILASIGVAEKFGKGSGFGIGLAFLPFIFYPVLGFGSATYVGPKTA
jgi:hypothetical protein